MAHMTHGQPALVLRGQPALVLRGQPALVLAVCWLAVCWHTRHTASQPWCCQPWCCAANGQPALVLRGQRAEAGGRAERLGPQLRSVRKQFLFLWYKAEHDVTAVIYQDAQSD